MTLLKFRFLTLNKYVKPIQEVQLCESQRSPAPATYHEPWLAKPWFFYLEEGPWSPGWCIPGRPSPGHSARSARATAIESPLLRALPLRQGRAKVFGKGSKECHVYFGKSTKQALWRYIGLARVEKLGSSLDMRAAVFYFMPFLITIMVVGGTLNPDGHRIITKGFILTGITVVVDP